MFAEFKLFEIWTPYFRLLEKIHGYFIDLFCQWKYWKKPERPNLDRGLFARSRIGSTRDLANTHYY